MPNGPSNLPRRLASAGRPLLTAPLNGMAHLTQHLRCLPTFLIIGAQRCGTTSLFKALRQHPCLMGPIVGKGVHYFDVQYERDLNFYRGRFPTRAMARARGSGEGAQIGESSPYYLFHPLVPERVARDLPGVRVIVALRDPVERAYSAHAHETARGYETQPFERALEMEGERLAREEQHLLDGGCSFSHRHHAYLARGHYIDQLLRWEHHLGRDRMHVVESEAFFTAPATVFADIEAFLGLPHHTGVRFDRHNARPRAGLPARLRDQLAEHFAPYDERLARWWGRTPGWRRRE
ncbi:sulfotransferase domain-containing protein [Salinactinospora qingdaonensis]